MSRRDYAWTFAAVCSVLAGSLVLTGGCSKNNPTPTVPSEQAPRSASGLYVSHTARTLVGLRWRDNSDDETGFRIERRGIDGAFAVHDTVAHNVVVFEDVKDLLPDRTYVYRVVAYRKAQAAAPSNEVSAQTILNHAPVFYAPRPEDGEQEIDPTLSLTLSWTATDPDSGDRVNFDVFFGATRGTLGQLASGIADSTQAVAQSLARNSHYFWQVIAHDSRGATQPSPIWGFTTVVDRDTIPAGPFVMGDTLLPKIPETPLHHPGNPVRLDRSFNIDRFEVTNQQYADFLNQMQDRGRLRVRDGKVQNLTGDETWFWLHPSAGDPTGSDDSEILFQQQDSVFVVVEGKEGFPAIEVSWYGAIAYAENYGRRLPTEAEWEKAARGTENNPLFAPGYLADSVRVGPDSVRVDLIGVGNPYPWGSWDGSTDLARGNFRNSGDPYETQGVVRTTPVGFYNGSVQGGYATLTGTTVAKNPYGLEDMAGNVWEWCDDWYGRYRAPHRPPDVTTGTKVLRGGSYDNPYGSAPTYNRASAEPNTTDRKFGFRTVKTN